MLEGVVKHDTDYDVVDATHYHPEERGTLECQLSNLADEIAYNTSDLDDGLRSSILDPHEVLELAISQRVLASLQLPAQVDLRDDLVRHQFIRRLVGLEVTDTIQATAQALTEAKVESLAGLRSLDHNIARYSSGLYGRKSRVEALPVPELLPAPPGRAHGRQGQPHAG